MPQKGQVLTEESRRKCRESQLARLHSADVKYLSETHPTISSQWHPDKNGENTPNNFTAGSDKKIWWRCPESCLAGCPHDYEATIYNRTSNNSGCPFCERKKICVHGSIVTTHPHIAAEWHPTKNESVVPETVQYGSKIQRWWLCPTKCPHGCLHEYTCTPLNRCGVNKANCPFCCNQQICIHSSIAFTHPDLSKEWHPTKNGTLEPSHISKGSTKKCWWLCEKGHVYDAVIKNRTSLNSGCPVCKHKTEMKLYEYIKSLFPDAIHGFRAPWCKSPLTGKHLPFDIYIPSLGIIVELDGNQHFTSVFVWSDYMYTQMKDVYKMHAALANGLRVIRFVQEEIYNADNTWLDTHVVPQLTHDETAIQLISITSDTIYTAHKDLLENSTLESMTATIARYTTSDSD